MGVPRACRRAPLLEQPFEPGAARRDLLGADAAELVEELERLCEQRILRIDGLGFRFRYDLVRQALLGSVSPARQRLLRRRLGQEGGAGTRLPVSRAIGSEAG